MLSLFVAAEGLLAWNEPLEDRSLQPHPTSSFSFPITTAAAGIAVPHGCLLGDIGLRQP
jgi:hypothetical protein